MLTDLKQNELDKAEERFFNSIFGSTTLDDKTQWLLKFLNIDINKQIQNFESIMKPVMLDNGLVNASLLRSLASKEYPLLSNIIPEKDFRLVDMVDNFSNIFQLLSKGTNR